MILVKNRLGKFYEQISWEIFTNVWEIFTNVWEIFTNVWEVFTNVFVSRNLPDDNYVKSSKTIVKTKWVIDFLTIRWHHAKHTSSETISYNILERGLSYLRLLISYSNPGDSFYFDALLCHWKQLLWKMNYDYRTEENELKRWKFTIDWP